MDCASSEETFRLHDLLTLFTPLRPRHVTARECERRVADKRGVIFADCAPRNLWVVFHTCFDAVVDSDDGAARTITSTCDSTGVVREDGGARVHGSFHIHG